MRYDYSAYRREPPKRPRRWRGRLPFAFWAVECALAIALIWTGTALPEHVVQTWMPGYSEAFTIGAAFAIAAALMNRDVLAQLCAGLGATAGSVLILMQRPFTNPAFPAEAETTVLLAVLFGPVILIGYALHEWLLPKWR